MDLPDGQQLYRRVAALLEIPRALTGDGVRRALEHLAGTVPGLEQVEVPSGTPVLDWTVPDEWNLRRATLTAPDGTVVVDTDDHMLGVLGYSEPVDVQLDRAALEPHLHSLLDRPDLIPWRTSYYRRTWGFCLPDRIRRALPGGTYHAVVDADLGPGRLTYGEAVLPGATDAEVLVTAHLCHPAMANDNASGMVIAAALAEALAARPARRLTYRFLLAPGTIGAITWLARNDRAAARAIGALVCSGVADPGERLTYKRSRRGDAPVDVAVELALRDLEVPHDLVEYQPWGYDERQFNSLGYDMGAGLLNRTPHGTYPEYHTSADDLSFIRPDHLREALDVALAAVDVLERDGTYVNRRPQGEPQLGRRGLYPSTGGESARTAQLAMLWVLAESDGSTPLTAIARRSGLAFAAIADAADALTETDLLDRADPG